MLNKALEQWATQVYKFQANLNLKSMARKNPLRGQGRKPLKKFAARKDQSLAVGKSTRKDGQKKGTRASYSVLVQPWSQAEIRYLCQCRAKDDKGKVRRTWKQTTSDIEAFSGRKIKSASQLNTRWYRLRTSKDPIYLEYFGPNKKPYQEVLEEVKALTPLKGRNRHPFIMRDYGWKIDTIIGEGDTDINESDEGESDASVEGDPDTRFDTDSDTGIENDSETEDFEMGDYIGEPKIVGPTQLIYREPSENVPSSQEWLLQQGVGQLIFRGTSRALQEKQELLRQELAGQLDISEPSSEFGRGAMLPASQNTNKVGYYPTFMEAESLYVPCISGNSMPYTDINAKLTEEEEMQLEEFFDYHAGDRVPLTEEEENKLFDELFNFENPQ
ncbi:MAG: hypothetical protein M1829_000478 [Trizodia sp. TS-e1964]|nr:MAG: hypothetical protein M1829_000478 [Trizodia sp. TS-e1964]